MSPQMDEMQHQQQQNGQARSVELRAVQWAMQRFRLGVDTTHSSDCTKHNTAERLPHASHGGLTPPAPQGGPRRAVACLELGGDTWTEDGRIDTEWAETRGLKIDACSQPCASMKKSGYYRARRPCAGAAFPPPARTPRVVPPAPPKPTATV